MSHGVSFCREASFCRCVDSHTTCFDLEKLRRLGLACLSQGTVKLSGKATGTDRGIELDELEEKFRPSTVFTVPGQGEFHVESQEEIRERQRKKKKKAKESAREDRGRYITIRGTLESSTSELPTRPLTIRLCHTGGIDITCGILADMDAGRQIGSEVATMILSHSSCPMAFLRPDQLSVSSSSGGVKALIGGRDIWRSPQFTCHFGDKRHRIVVKLGEKQGSAIIQSSGCIQVMGAKRHVLDVLLEEGVLEYALRAFFCAAGIEDQAQRELILDQALLAPSSPLSCGCQSAPSSQKKQRVAPPSSSQKKQRVAPPASPSPVGAVFQATPSDMSSAETAGFSSPVPADRDQELEEMLEQSREHFDQSSLCEQPIEERDEIPQLHFLLEPCAFFQDEPFTPCQFFADEAQFTDSF